jgi:Tfp pilus assembly protein PilX
MIWCKQRMRRLSSDDGISLIEVVVALMVFSLISIGVAFSTVTIARMTEDTRSREIATNLAASNVDIARGIDDTFDISDTTTNFTISGKVYTVTRATTWVDSSGADIACGTGTGVLKTKRVKVTVDWTGRLTSTPLVEVDTLIAPDDRINDPSLGTIRVSTIGVGGDGSAGVSVSVVPVTGGATLLVQPDNTDNEGCSYALKVTPGTYNVTISRTNSIDSNQKTSPVNQVTVGAGGSVATQFQYDYSAKFALTYASNYGGSTPLFPTNLDTVYISTYGQFLDSGKKTQISLHPFTSGYSGIAGKYVSPVHTDLVNDDGCVSPDPAAWPAATVGGTALSAGVRANPVAAAPGNSTAVAMGIPMGVASVAFTGSAYLFASPAVATAAAGDPGCVDVSPTAYSFGQVLINGTISVALPYGSWTLYSSTTANGTKTPIPTTSMALLGGGRGLRAGNVITFDPRVP